MVYARTNREPFTDKPVLGTPYFLIGRAVITCVKSHFFISGGFERRPSPELLDQGSCLRAPFLTIVWQFLLDRRQQGMYVVARQRP